MSVRVTATWPGEEATEVYVSAEEAFRVAEVAHRNGAVVKIETEEWPGLADLPAVGSAKYAAGDYS